MAEALQVKNQDIVGLYDRINRFIVELIKCTSSAVANYNEFDQARLESYLTSIDTYHAWVITQPHLDLPETAPRSYTLETPPEIPNVENEDVNDAVRMMVVCRDELTNSQSAMMPAQMLSFDSSRLTAIVQKVRNFLNEYIRKTTPMDLPESSPREASSGTGLVGIK